MTQTLQAAAGIDADVKDGVRVNVDVSSVHRASAKPVRVTLDDDHAKRKMLRVGISRSPGRARPEFLRVTFRAVQAQRHAHAPDSSASLADWGMPRATNPPVSVPVTVMSV